MCQPKSEGGGGGKGGDPSQRYIKRCISKEFRSERRSSSNFVGNNNVSDGDRESVHEVCVFQIDTLCSASRCVPVSLVRISRGDVSIGDG